MREIKFKAKRVSDGEWVDGSFIYPNEIMPNPSTCDEIDIGVPIIIDPNTLCQFTGLCDRNGKETYEGDIVRDQHTTFKVVWSKGLFNFDRIEGGYQYPSFGYNCNRMEVIGNIHNK